MMCGPKSDTDPPIQILFRQKYLSILKIGCEMLKNNWKLNHVYRFWHWKLTHVYRFWHWKPTYIGRTSPYTRYREYPSGLWHLKNFVRAPILRTSISSYTIYDVVSGFAKNSQLFAVLSENNRRFSVFGQNLGGFSVFGRNLGGFSVLGTPLDPPHIT